VVAGATITLSVTATGTGSLTYQWSKNGTAISGATSSTLSIANSSASDAGSYKVVVSTSATSVTSNTVTVTVNVPPSISSQPTASLTYSGSTASLSVTAAGTIPLNYQWYKDGTAINGAISSSYTLSGSALDKAGAYSVVVSNIAGTVTSSTSTVVTPPVITTQPVTTLVTAGTSVTLSVAASGSPTLAYQWRKEGTNIAGATASSYTLGNPASSDGGSYSVVVSNSYGSVTSNSVTLTVTPAPSAPSITTQPASQSATVGFSLNLSVSVSGSAPYTYTWKRMGQPSQPQVPAFPARHSP
jgi:hypothetical protein